MTNMRRGRPSTPATPRATKRVTAAGGVFVRVLSPGSLRGFPPGSESDAFFRLSSFHAPRRVLAMSPATVPIFLDGRLALSAT